MTHKRAMLAALTAFFVWVVYDAFIKLATEAAFTPFQTISILGVISVIGIIGLVACKRDFCALRPHNIRGQAILCLCTLDCGYANVIALKHLPLTVFYILVFTAPLMVALLASLLKHEILTKTKIVCVVAGFAGVVIAIAPNIEKGGEWIGYLAALTSAAGFAVYMIVINKISATDSMESIQFFNALTLTAFGFIGAGTQGTLLPDWRIAVLLVVGGVLGFLGNVLHNKALQHTSSTNVAQLHYTQIIAGALCGYALWHEKPTWNLVVGATVIVISGMIVAAQAHRQDKAEVTLLH